jgi:hypothetical protein
MAPTSIAVGSGLSRRWRASPLARARACTHVRAHELCELSRPGTAPQHEKKIAPYFLNFEANRLT